MSTTLFVTGASSGIGACFVGQLPEEIGHTVTFSRRQGPGDWHEADLAHPRTWPGIGEVIERTLDTTSPDHAIFFHCSGSMEPMARVADADPMDYALATLLNFASGPALGQAFLRSCATRGIRATLVMTSSPAAQKVLPMLAHYSAGKAGMEQWARCVATELTTESGSRVITVVPYAVLTEMVREVMKEDPASLPLVNYFREVEAADEFATPEATADQIWAAIATAANGSFIPVGAVVIAERAAQST